MSCINKNLREYQNLKNSSGVSELLLDATCKYYLDTYGRFPHLDEIPSSNSKPYLEQKLKINKYRGTKISNILEHTNAATIEEAIISLNNSYSDLEIDIAPIVNEAIVSIEKRPTDEYKPIKEWHTPDSEVYMQGVLNYAIDRLNSLYGIKVNSISDEDLESEEWKDIIPRDSIAKGFIYNGNIYINVDRATPDTLLHEMMHLLIGSLRFNNPQLYLNLINTAENFESYKYRVEEFPSKSRNDINEEIFVTELGKYLAGMKSEIGGLDPRQLYEINYHVRRTLDTILMGDLSTNTLDDTSLYNMSFRQVAENTNSPILTNQYHGTLDLKGSELHRKINNLKEQLIRDGHLKEYCE